MGWELSGGRWGFGEMSRHVENRPSECPSCLGSGIKVASL